MMEAAVRIEGLNVWYESFQALSNVSLSVPVGSVYAILGPSGCGKSTLLRTINKLILLRKGVRVEGKIEVLGVDIYGSPNSDGVLAKVGMVFQTPNPFPHLSVYDNVAIGPKLRGTARGRELDELVKLALEKAGLWEEVKDRLRKPASDLSGGQQQRLCIARALAMKPEILLMDEPTANLDPLNAAKIEELVRELSRDMTIIIVTHDAEQAKRLASHGALLFMGKVISNGPLSLILSRSYNDILQTLVNDRIAAQKAKPVPRELEARRNGRIRLPWR